MTLNSAESRRAANGKRTRHADDDNDTEDSDDDDDDDERDHDSNDDKRTKLRADANANANKQPAELPPSPNSGEQTADGLAGAGVAAGANNKKPDEGQRPRLFKMGLLLG